MKGLDRVAPLAMTAGAWPDLSARIVIANRAAVKQSSPVPQNRQPAVYIMASRRNGTLYVGVTSNLVQRAWQHREGKLEGFTARYGCKMLVWFELYEDMEHAILREEQIKAGSRQKKLALIEGVNPSWRDFYPDIVG